MQDLYDFTVYTIKIVALVFMANLISVVEYIPTHFHFPIMLTNIFVYVKDFEEWVKLVLGLPATCVGFYLLILKALNSTQDYKLKELEKQTKQEELSAKKYLNKNIHKDIDEMLKNGKLTQEEYDKIVSLFR